MKLRYLKPKKEFSYKDPNPEVLDTFPNPGVIDVELTCREFTSLCPVTGQPDYAVIGIDYTPDKLCLESKSLKLYLGMYRLYGGFCEQVTHKICEDLFKVLTPKNIVVRGVFTWRGGIKIEAFSQK